MFDFDTLDAEWKLWLDLSLGEPILALVDFGLESVGFGWAYVYEFELGLVALIFFEFESHSFQSDGFFVVLKFEICLVD